MALWDIAGKVAGLPIHRLLGTHHTQVKSGFASWYYNDTDRGIELARRVREAVGDSMDLMLDPHGAYSFADALRVSDAVHELGFLWLEDPLNAHDLYAYSKLCEKARLPIIATGLSPIDLRAYAPWITGRATDALRGDVALKAGRVEILSADAPGRYTLDSFNWGLAEPWAIDQGLVSAPTGPGLGVRLDEDLLRHSQVAVLR